MSENYLYHYYPIRNSDEILESENEFETSKIYTILKKHPYDRKKIPYPYRDLYDINYLLGKNKLWLTKYKDQNDPFEFDGYYERSLISDTYYNYYCSTPLYQKNPVTKEKWDNEFSPNQSLFHWNELTSNESSSFKHHGMYSFCLNPKSIQMWSYYGCSHQGICVKFKINKEIKEDFSISRYWDEDSNSAASIILGKVNSNPCGAFPITINKEIFNDYYQKWHKKILDEKSDTNFNHENFTVYDLIFSNIMLTKAKSWEHEDEFRLITLGYSCENAGDGLDVNFRLPESDTPFLEIDGIIFGCKTPSIFKKIIVNSYPHLDFFETVKIHGQYALEIKKLAV